MINKINQVLNTLNIDLLKEFRIEVNRDRCFFPTATIYPEMKIIVIKGNPASVERYGLAELLVHEIAEYDYYLRYDGEFSNHNHKFQAIEQAYRNIITKKIVEEHG